MVRTNKNLASKDNIGVIGFAIDNIVKSRTIEIFDAVMNMLNTTNAINVSEDTLTEIRSYLMALNEAQNVKLCVKGTKVSNKLNIPLDNINHYVENIMRINAHSWLSFLRDYREIAKNEILRNPNGKVYVDGKVGQNDITSHLKQMWNNGKEAEYKARAKKYKDSSKLIHTALKKDINTNIIANWKDYKIDAESINIIKTEYNLRNTAPKIKTVKKNTEKNRTQKLITDYVSGAE